MEAWQKIWEEHGALPNWGLPKGLVLPPLEKKSTAEVRKVAATFAENTGIGCDDVPPKHYSLLSDEALGALIEFYEAVEENVSWPLGVFVNVMVRLGKPDGGSRLIGLLPTVMRIWGRLHRGEVMDWEEEHDIP
eukprot:2891185-Lingulodinium_polyedra.AAC.1